MTDRLKGVKVAFLATDMVEQAELTGPWEALRAAGAQTRARLARDRRDPGLQPLRQGRWVPGRPDRRRRQGIRLRRARAPGRRRQPRRAAHGRERRPLRARVLRAGQARRGDLPRALGADRGRRRRRPHAHLLALSHDRPRERRCQSGRPRSRRRRKPRDEPQARRHPRLQREAARGVRGRPEARPMPRRPARACRSVSRRGSNDVLGPATPGVPTASREGATEVRG